MTTEQPTTREATCECGATFTQRDLGFAGKAYWLPKVCGACAQRLYEEAAHREHEETERVRSEADRKFWDRLHCPPDYRGVTLESFRRYGSPADQQAQARVLRIVTQYLGTWPDVRRLIVFTGDVGTGKTHLMWAIGIALARQHGADVKVTRVADMIREIRSTWRPGAQETEAMVLRRYREVDFLALDELSLHAFYGEPVQHLFDVLNDRHEWRRPTLITSNETPERVTEILGKPLTDRLVHQGGFLEFSWPSYRRLPTADRVA